MYTLIIRIPLNDYKAIEDIEEVSRALRALVNSTSAGVADSQLEDAWSAAMQWIDSPPPDDEVYEIAEA